MKKDFIAQHPELAEIWIEGQRRALEDLRIKAASFDELSTAYDALGDQCEQQKKIIEFADAVCEGLLDRVDALEAELRIHAPAPHHCFDETVLA